MKSPNFDFCNVDVHKASYAKHLRNIKDLEIDKQEEMIKPEWLFQEPVEN